MQVTAGIDYNDRTNTKLGMVAAWASPPAGPFARIWSEDRAHHLAFYAHTASAALKLASDLEAIAAHFRAQAALMQAPAFQTLAERREIVHQNYEAIVKAEGEVAP